LSAIHVFEYIIGIGGFGLCFWLLDGIRVIIDNQSQTGAVFDLAVFAWYGSIIAYLLFGGIWLIRKYAKEAPGG